MTCREPGRSNEVHDSEPLSIVIARFVEANAPQQVTLAELLSVLGDRSLEALLLVLALPMVVPVPAPGLSVAFGIPMTIIAVQLALGRKHVWLPSAFVRRPIAHSTFSNIARRAVPALERLERIVRPRATWLVGRWAAFPVGLICAVLALIIALPIPLGHFVPGLAISLLSLGLLERDALVVCLGVLTAIAGVLLVIFASLGAAHLLALL